jgi:hypothetical protein
MLIKDHAEYRAYYCGLCKALGKEFSQLTRFSINYDITFLALLAHNVLKVTPIIKQSRCIAHPIGRKFPIAEVNPIFKKIAHINVILGYYKAKDDVLDGGGFKYKLAKALFYFKFRRAKKTLPDFNERVKECYVRLREMEARGEESLDKLADAFAVMLTEVGKTAFNKIDDNLYALCYNLGRWIYLIDAYDDLEKDISKGRFNPFAPSGELTDEIRSKALESAEFSLKTAVNMVRECYDKMDITVSEGALSNVIYLGLNFKTAAVLNARCNDRGTSNG